MDRRVVLITGVSRGLGRAMLEEFAAQGHTVIGCSRSATPINDLRKEFPAPHSFTAVDVCDAKTVEAWANDVVKLSGPPSLLLNNAALVNHNAPLWEIGPDEFNQVIDVNIKGVFNVIRAFVPA